MHTANGMPCTFPLGDVSGVFMSAWASIQMTPSFRSCRAKMLGHGGDRADGDRMVASQHQRETPSLHNRFDALRAARSQVLAICGR